MMQIQFLSIACWVFSVYTATVEYFGPKKCKYTLSGNSNFQKKLIFW